MKVDINNTVSIDAANQDFSRVARLVDERGPVVILQNNVPRYIVMEISEFQQEAFVGDDELFVMSKRILEKTVTPMRCLQNKSFAQT